MMAVGGMETSGTIPQTLPAPLNYLCILLKKPGALCYPHVGAQPAHCAFQRVAQVGCVLLILSASRFVLAV